MSTPTTLYRFDATGRYVGWLTVDRPIEQYEGRTDLTEEEPPAAQEGHFVRRVDGAWVQTPNPVPELETARALKWGEMKAARRAAIEAALVTPYGTFDADFESRQNIVQTAQLMQTAAQTLAPADQPTVDFTRADNSVVTLTAGQMVEVALLLANQIQAAFARGRELREAIDAATTAEEVDAITWSTP